MRIVLGLFTVLFALAGLLVAPLSLAAFSSINPNAPDALRLLAGLESGVASHFHIAQDAFWRGAGYMLLACLLIWIAAYIKPRARPVRPQGA